MIVKCPRCGKIVITENNPEGIHTCRLPTGQAGMVLGWHWDWVSIKDRMPEKDQNVLVFYPDGIEVATFTGKEFCPDHFCENPEWWAVSHWMPLPLPPPQDHPQDLVNSI